MQAQEVIPAPARAMCITAMTETRLSVNGKTTWAPSISADLIMLRSGAEEGTVNIQHATAMFQGAMLENTDRPDPARIAASASSKAKMISEDRNAKTVGPGSTRIKMELHRVNNARLGELRGVRANRHAENVSYF